MTKIIAYYLPQFHPIPENDKAWGKNFTEWDNVRNAIPLFKGHRQPRIPADLGYYDLRNNDIKQQQIQLAKQAGIYGFCYWHYWFNGKQVLQTPFSQVLADSQLDFPFCLCWANHSWKTTTWSKATRHNDKYIIKQTYGREDDYRQHFETLLPAFCDPRYIQIDGKPLFGIFDPYAIPNIKQMITSWQQWAKENGLNGIYFYSLANNTSTIQRDQNGNIKRIIPDLKHSDKVYNKLLNLGFDAVQSLGMARGEMLAYGKVRTIVKKYLHQHFRCSQPLCFDYQTVVQNMFAPEDRWENIFPSIIPDWDRTPRAGKKAIVYTGSTPEKFEQHIKQAIQIIKDKQPQHRILFLRAWNEWAEGCYVEPDNYYKHQYLDAIHNALQ